MTNTSWLPKFLRWMFAIFSIFTALGVLALLLLLAIDPSLPHATHFGPLTGKIEGLPASLMLRDSVLTATALNGAVNVRIENTAGLIPSSVTACRS